MAINYNFYKIFLQACAKHYDNAAVIYYKNGKYFEFLYSEAFGVCEYIFQQLQSLDFGRGYVGLFMIHNPLIPSLIAAIHKNGSAFMFLDPTSAIRDNQRIIDEMNFHIIISICEDKDNLKNINGIKREKSLSLYGYFVHCYKIADVTQSPLFTSDVSYTVNSSKNQNTTKITHVTHETLKYTMEGLRKIIMPQIQDVIMFSTHLTCDRSIIDLYLAVIGGSSLFIAPEDMYIIFPIGEKSKYAVTIWQMTPSKLLQFSNSELSHFIFGANSTLRVLILGGEPLSSVTRLKMMKDVNNETKLYSLYGVTGVTCCACVAEVSLQNMEIDEEVPIGKCLPGIQLEICKSNIHESIGQIILGIKLRRYVKFEPKTSFMKNGIVWTETGDLGEMKNNKIYHRGRMEDVIDRSGREINLNYIERTAAKCPNINSVSAVWIPHINFIILFFVSDTVTPEDLKLYLRHRLDHFHQPDRTMNVSRLPLNANGKVAKKLLIENVINANSITDIFAKEVHNIIGLSTSYSKIKDTTFLELGGSSLTAAILSNRLTSLYKDVNPTLATILLDPNCTIDPALQISQKNAQRVKRTSSRHSVQKKYIRNVKLDKPTRRKCSGSDICNRHDITYIMNESNFKVVWHLNMARCVDANPTIFQSETNLLVCIGSHSGRIVVADGHTGIVKGSIETGSRIESSVLCFNYGHSRCDNGVVGTLDGTIYCFMLKDCKISWSIDIKSVIKSQAVLVDDHIYVAAYDGYVRTLKVTNGFFKQMIYISSSGISGDLDISTDRRHIAAATLDGTCVILNTSSGKIEWKMKVGSPVFAKPVIFNYNKCVMFAEVNGIVHCFQMQSGTELWNFSNVDSHIFSSFLVNCNKIGEWKIIFGCNDSYVYCLGQSQSDTPVLLWKTKTSSSVYATPCSVNEDDAVVASSDGKLCTLDTTNGIINDYYQLPSQVFSTPRSHNRNIYIGCRDDCLYCLHHSEAY